MFIVRITLIVCFLFCLPKSIASEWQLGALVGARSPSPNYDDQASTGYEFGFSAMKKEPLPFMKGWSLQASLSYARHSVDKPAFDGSIRLLSLRTGALYELPERLFHLKIHGGILLQRWEGRITQRSTNLLNQDSSLETAIYTGVSKTFSLTKRLSGGPKLELHYNTNKMTGFNTAGLFELFWAL